MLTSTGPRVFRFLLSLVIRARLSIGNLASAFRARFASFWRSILTFARCSGQSQIRLVHASGAPVADNNPVGRRPPVSERAKAEEEHSGTLAALPVWRTINWQENIIGYQAFTSDHQSGFDTLPATPDRASQRYKPRRVSQRAAPLHIPPGQKRLLSALPPLPDRWRRHVHPEGNVLYYHEELRIFTESDIIQHEKEIIFRATSLIQQATQTDDVIMDALTEIVLNVHDNGHWHYYFVDHTNRLLFWMQSVHPREHLDTGLRGITEYSHISTFGGIWSRQSTGMHLLVVFEYITYDMGSRAHCGYYPHSRSLPKGVFEDLRGMLNYAKTDMMTTDSSPSPFAQDELVAILDLVNSLKDDEKISDPYSIWVIARLMEVFTENQFMNFCGQPCARLNADRPLFGQQTWNRRTVFKIINVLLFGSPHEHANRLQRIWVDGIIIQPRWKDFINRLTNEFGRYTIFSTVMLAVNFSFLAVPGVVTPGTAANQIEIIIYCSVVSTTASIVFSFVLLNVYSDPGLSIAGSAADAMLTLSQTKSGMTFLAITHSLPFTCLIWSIALFSTALAIQIFGPKQLATVVALGVECLILVSLGVISMRVMRRFSMNEEVDDVDTPAEKGPPPTGSQHHV